MENIKQELENLYNQKKQIEDRILFFEQKLLEIEKQKNSKVDFSKDEKIEIFKNLFVGRFDIFARKWISADKTKENFFAVSKTFQKEDFIPFTDDKIEEHLRGIEHYATYSINQNNECKFLVFEIIDSDKFALQIALNSLGVKAYYEINSKNSILAWIFFEEELFSKDVFNFANYVLNKANISAKTYPNKPFATKQSLGAPLELPLQLKYRNKHKTIFIDANTNKIYENQWQVLYTVLKTSKETVLKYSDNLNHEIIKEFEDIKFPSFELKIKLYDFIYIPTKNLSASFLKKLKSFASFENPQIKLLMQLRKPLYNTPRVINGFDEDDRYLMMPRGTLNILKDFFNQNQLKYSIEDKRYLTKVETKTVSFKLRPEQDTAIKEICKSDFSICVAPPGFGKTLIGAKMFEVRKCSTLIVVNKNMLLTQWIQRFVDYFGYSKKDIGMLGKSNNTLNGKIDVATMQSLKNQPEIIKNYSFVIVDECHHIPAVTFEQIIKNFAGKYILGLSATPNRKDALEPILFYQLGEISYEYKKKRTHNNKLQVIRTEFKSESSNYSTLINELCVDEKRNNLILESIIQNINRKILVLTDRIEHINVLESMLNDRNIDFVAIHGSMNKKEQVEKMRLVNEKSLVLATTSYFGEGIDFPHLNTIIFATPISYYGRLVQYLGRIGRGNQECLAIDFLDSQNAMLNSSYKKRLDGYKQMHYK